MDDVDRQEPHFGQWLKRIRNKLRMSQQDFAPVVGMRNRAGVDLLEKRAEPEMLGSTLEAMLDSLGYESHDKLIEAWMANKPPDIGEVRLRIRELEALRKPETVDALVLDLRNRVDALEKEVQSLRHELANRS